MVPASEWLAGKEKRLQSEAKAQAHLQKVRNRSFMLEAQAVWLLRRVGCSNSRGICSYLQTLPLSVLRQLAVCKLAPVSVHPRLQSSGPNVGQQGNNLKSSNNSGWSTCLQAIWIATP